MAAFCFWRGNGSSQENDGCLRWGVTYVKNTVPMQYSPELTIGEQFSAHVLSHDSGHPESIHNQIEKFFHRPLGHDHRGHHLKHARTPYFTPLDNHTFGTARCVSYNYTMSIHCATGKFETSVVSEGIVQVVRAGDTTNQDLGNLRHLCPSTSDGSLDTFYSFKLAVKKSIHLFHPPLLSLPPNNVITRPTINSSPVSIHPTIPTQ